jgi:hypothetical protein
MIRVDPVILCIDCGGRAHLLSYEPHEGWADGDVAAYRCEDCLDRWDIVLEDDDAAGDDGESDETRGRERPGSEAGRDEFERGPSTGTHHWP